MRITYIDLETSPLLGYAWQMWEANILSLQKDSGLLSFAWKIDDGTTQVVSTREYTERQLVKMLWKIFDEAEILCAHNGDKFDIKVSNKLFLKYKLKPPSPYKTIDTLKIAKKHFRFDSNKLDSLARYLLGEQKVSTDMTLWLDCMAGDTKALLHMEKYCKHDVDIQYRVYQTLKGWHTGHPNANLYDGTTHQCPNCSGNTQKRGFMYSRTGKWQRHQCTTCGAWSKGVKIKSDKVIS